MTNLLVANFMRLKKNNLFWTGMLAMFAFAALTIIMQYREHIKYGNEASLNSPYPPDMYTSRPLANNNASSNDLTETKLSP